MGGGRLDLALADPDEDPQERQPRGGRALTGTPGSR